MIVVVVAFQSLETVVAVVHPLLSVVVFGDQCLEMFVALVVAVVVVVVVPAVVVVFVQWCFLLC
jgi:hypothetical protein